MTPNATGNTDTCQDATPYSGQICSEIFASLQTCYSSESSLPINIPANIDQDQVETTANQLISALIILHPTEECSESIRPFLCLHLFGLCDSNGVLHTTLRGECEEIRDMLCSREWKTAVILLPSGTLPVCEALSDQTEECAG